MNQIHEWRIQVIHMHNGYYRGQASYLAARLAGVRKVYVTEHLAPQKNERLEVLMQELCTFEKQVRSIARSDRRVKLLMTTPGVGAIVA